MPTKKFQNFMAWRNHNRRSYGQARYVTIHIWKIDEFGWLDLEIFSEYAGTQFTSTEFKE